MSEMIVGYDGSAGADVALATAVALAKKTGDGVALIFCYEPPAIRAGGAGDQRDVVEGIGRDTLEAAIARHADDGVPMRGELVDARPVDGLIAAADECDAPIIVVGHHGEGPLHGALIGATANKLLHQSERPILVVPADGD